MHTHTHTYTHIYIYQKKKKRNRKNQEYESVGHVEKTESGEIGRKQTNKQGN